MAGPSLIGPATGRDTTPHVCLCIRAPCGPTLTCTPLSLENHLGPKLQQSQKGAPPAVYHGQLIYIYKEGHAGSLQMERFSHQGFTVLITPQAIEEILSQTNYCQLQQHLTCSNNGALERTVSKYLGRIAQRS